MSSAPDHLYLDLSIVNNSTSGDATIPLNFRETRTNPILDNPANYFMTVARFEVDTPGFSLPMFIPKLRLDGQNTSLNSTAYSVTIATLSGSPTPTAIASINQQYVVWSPQDKSAKLPNNQTVSSASTILTTQDVTTGYYNCYTAKWWLNCVNAALASAWTITTTAPPQLVIDPLTNLITLLCPYSASPLVNLAIGEDVACVSSYLGTTLVPPASNLPNITHAIFFNEPLYNLFSAFNAIYYGKSIPQATLAGGVIAQVAGIPEGYRIFSNYIQPVNYNFMNEIIITPPAPATPVTPALTYITLTSDYSPVPMWNPIQSIVFSTSMIPIHYSMSNPPQVYGSSPFDTTFLGAGGNNSDISTMVSDIQIPLTSGNEYKPTITYTPSGEYRLIDLLGNAPINEMGFAISYKTKFGQIIPFALAPQCGANLKILFRRKRFNLGNVTPYDTN